MLHKNIDRINAESDLRTIDLMLRTQSSDGVKSLIEERQAAMKSPFTFHQRNAMTEAKLDRAGLARLKEMSGKKK